MKRAVTKSGNKWAHVSCALWIPEVSITDPERMEPISKVGGYSSEVISFPINFNLIFSNK